jgi:hypothetical protein
LARHAIAGRSTVVGTNLRAQFSLFATAAVRPRIMEIGVFNTTATAVAVAVARFTAATNVGAGLTETYLDDDVHVPIATGFAGHTGDGTVGGVIRQGSLGAAIGSGVIWTFSGSGLEIPAGTANGVGVVVPTGTGQICDFHIEWEE